MFTERAGGASSPPFSTLNLGLHTGDDPEVVERNRSDLSAALGVGGFMTTRQVHGTEVLRVGEGRTRAHGELGVADALQTDTARFAVAVLTADCVPLALASEQAGDLSVVHIGWRGLASGMVQRAVASFGSSQDLVASIGPAIGPCHYEVGEEVISAVQKGTDQAALTRTDGSSLFLDLPGTVERVLRRAGLQEVERAEECTACEEGRFFSYRRDGRTGRQGLVAMRL